MNFQEEAKHLGKNYKYVQEYSEEFVQEVLDVKDNEKMDKRTQGLGAQESKMLVSFVTEKPSMYRFSYELLNAVCIENDLDRKKYAAKIDPKYADEAFMETYTILVKKEIDTQHVSGRLCLLIKKYQENPELLDGVIKTLIPVFMELLQELCYKLQQANQFVMSMRVQQIFRVLYTMCDVRGFKTVLGLFPNKVSDMEPVTEILHFQGDELYFIQYILILWLSVIVLVPFDLTTIDSEKNQEELVQRIINIALDNSCRLTKSRDAASLLLAKLLTRPDVIKSGRTDQTIQKMIQRVQEAKNDSNQVMTLVGISQNFVELFKLGHRNDFVGRIDLVFEPIIEAKFEDEKVEKSSMLRKYKMKLAQRLGLQYLKPRVTKWRYQRGSRSLTQNLGGGEVQSSQATADEDDDEEMDDDDVDYDKLEVIIQVLLEGLKDEDNIVRWSAAKGIGRITGRLDKEMADQIVEQLQDLFGKNETDASWHGGCLCLGELCRRGLLLPERLDKFVPLMHQALVYDINRGNHSVGAHVRDSACYVLWSFARAYSSEIMKPHVATLSTQLIVVALFDREVNCRRAASATFQECVGRQGNFPHGIDILTEADYFTVGNRINAYLNVSCFVGQYEEYFDNMVKHLAFEKLRHYEQSIRELAAQALSVLCCFYPQKMVDLVITPLIAACTDPNLHVRHGAMIGISEIMIGLSGNSIMHKNATLEAAFKDLSLEQRKLLEESEAQKKYRQHYETISKENHINQVFAQNPKQLQEIQGLVQRVIDAKLHKGKGGEIIRQCLCKLIQSFGISQLSISFIVRQQMIDVLLENATHTAPEVQNCAVDAFFYFCQGYFGSDAQDEEVNKIFDTLIKKTQNARQVAQILGSTRVFGVLSGNVLRLKGKEIIQILIANCQIKGTEFDDADTRKAAVKSLIQIVKSLGFSGIEPQLLVNIYEQFHASMNDYAIDRRGDIGSIVREECMRSLYELILLIKEDESRKGEEILKAGESEFYERFLKALLQQLMEKIDRVRDCAGRLLQKFFKFVSPHIIQYHGKDQLHAMFLEAENALSKWSHIDEKDGIQYLAWRDGKFVFKLMMPMFDDPIYAHSVMIGLITSSGGISASTLQASSNSLYQYLSKIKAIKKKEEREQKMKEFLQRLIAIFQQNSKVDRLTVPLMKTIEMLIESDYLGDATLVDELMAIHACTVLECNKSKNMVKLMAAVGVFSGMLSAESPELLTKAVRSLLFLLYHSYPKIRKLTAEKFYTAILSMEDCEIIFPGGEDDSEEAQTVISETDWAQDLKVLNEEKTKLYGYFGMEPKAPTVKKTDQPMQVDTN